MPTPTRSTKPKPKRRVKANSADDEDADENEDGDAIIRCLCGAGAEDSGGMMVCCDKCSCWQHNRCMGFPQDPKALPENYLCERCGPEIHQQLLEKMARGEKPWEGRGWKRQPPGDKASRAKNNSASKKQDTPKKEESDKPVESPKDAGRARGQSAVEAAGLKKRKSRGEEAEEQANNGAQVRALGVTSYSGQSDCQQAPQAKVRKVQDPPAKPAMSPPPPPPPKADARKVKSSPSTAEQAKEATGKAMSKPQQDALQTELVGHWNELQNSMRKRSAEHLVKKMTGAISDAVGKKRYSLPEDSTADGLGMRLGLEVERAVLLRHSNVPGDPSPAYRQQIRTLAFNLGKNYALSEGLIRNTLTPDSLSQMSSEDMASEELQRRDAKMKRESEKQNVLIKEDGPRIRRTHKGEEVVGGETERGDANESIFAVPPPRRRESIPNPDTPVTATSSHAMSPMTPQSRTFSDGAGFGGNSTATSPVEGQPLSVNTQGLSSDVEKKPSSTFNIQDVWSSVQSPDDQRAQQLGSTNIQRLPYETARGTVEGGGNVAADPEIDELLRGEEAESPPYSPTEYPVDPSVVWQGKVSMYNMAEFFGTAKHVAGADLSATLPWSQLVPVALKIEGRIVAERATNYLCELRYSRTTDVVVIAVRPNDGPLDIDEFDKLWDYFSSRDRYGVVAKNANPAVKDTYIIPVDAGTGKLPVFMEMLEHNTLEEPRPEKVLLVTFVVKGSGSVARDAQNPVAASPAEPQTPTPIALVNQTPFGTAGAMVDTPVASQSPPYDPASHKYNGVAPTQVTPTMPVQYDGASFTMAPSTATSNGQGSPMIPPGSAAVVPPNINPMVVQVLGPLVDSVVMRQVLANSPQIGIMQLTIIKDILERVPAARDDINLFTQLLTEKSRAEGR